MEGNDSTEGVVDIQTLKAQIMQYNRAIKDVSEK